MATYKTKVYLTCSSNQKNYTFAFDYINKRYIKARLNNTRELQWGTDYTVAEHTLSLVSNPPQGALLEIYRETPSDRTVEWYDSSILRAKDLNLFNVQMLHINEENADMLQDSGIQEDKIDNKWDARLKPIKNLADPTSDDEAVNLGWLSKTQSSYLSATQAKLDEATRQATRSTSEADRAKREADRATTQADNALAQATTATAEADRATTQADKAKEMADFATTKADLSATSAFEAVTSANSAESSARQAKESEEVVLTNASIAVSSAEVATKKAEASESSANLSKFYAEQAKEQAGGDFATHSELDTAKYEASDNLRNALEQHNTSDVAHAELFRGVANELYKKADSTDIDSMYTELTNKVNSKADNSTVTDIQNQIDEKISNIDLSKYASVTGQTFTGNIAVNSNDYSKISLINTSGESTIFEGAPASSSSIGSILKKDNTGNISYLLKFPKEGGTFATREYVDKNKGTSSEAFRQNNTGNTHLIRNNYWGIWTSTSGLNFDWFSGNKNPYITFDASGIKIQGTLVRHVVNSWHNPANGDYWREWSDGWVEQGGYVTGRRNQGTYSYHKPCKNKPIITITIQSISGKNLDVSKTHPAVRDVSTTNFTFITPASDNMEGFYWKVEGYKA